MATIRRWNVNQLADGFNTPRYVATGGSYRQIAKAQ
jgi:hypothetical protein